jgi:hypothetical protein
MVIDDAESYPASSQKDQVCPKSPLDVWLA